MPPYYILLCHIYGNMVNHEASLKLYVTDPFQRQLPHNTYVVIVINIKNSNVLICPLEVNTLYM